MEKYLRENNARKGYCVKLHAPLDYQRAGFSKRTLN